MKCEDCSTKIELPKQTYTYEKWTTIEVWHPDKEVWLEIEYRTIDSVREYRLTGEIDSYFNVLHASGDSEQNKRSCYDEWSRMVELGYLRLGWC